MNRRLTIVAALLSFLLPPTAHAQLPAPLDEAALRMLVPGSTMSAVNSRGQSFREVYREDGRLTATSTRTDGSCCISDGGKWEIEAGQFCRQYDNWGDRRRFCHQIGRVGDSYVNMSNGSRMEFVRP
ncbi:MAG: hypothetical protein O9277_02945 [Magnetospirillum sp.]|nr:hypothetical protein [Magnetospirillum sp.]